MKHFLNVFSVVLVVSACTAILDSPGTLGVSESHSFNCPSTDIDYALAQLPNNKRFQWSHSDSSAVNWWTENGYDFVQPRCIKVKKCLYMFTLDDEDANTCELSIRSYYNEKKKDWIFAKGFNSAEHSAAEKALNQLLFVLPNCDY